MHRFLIDLQYKSIVMLALGKFQFFTQCVLGVCNEVRYSPCMVYSVAPAVCHAIHYTAAWPVPAGTCP